MAKPHRLYTLFFEGYYAGGAGAGGVLARCVRQCVPLLRITTVLVLVRNLCIEFGCVATIL